MAPREIIERWGGTETARRREGRMRYGVIGENLFERAVLASGMAPKAMIEGYAPAFARAVVLATEHGIFEALAAGPCSSDAVAATCHLDPRATKKVMDLLVAMRYLKSRSGGTGSLVMSGAGS